jgi:hypothetical protein
MGSYRWGLVVAIATLAVWAQTGGSQWKHLSTKTGDLEPPNSGKEQTSATVFDINGDGVNDFVITERTAAPSVVAYIRNQTGWKRYVVDPEPLHIEAGATYYDVDGDGHLDFLAAGDWKTNEVWWWENPGANLKPDVPWKRHIVKNSLKPKHHDMIMGDFDGDGKDELVFWNQDAAKLMLARIPPNPRQAGPWPLTEVYAYNTDSEMEPRGKPDSFRGTNEHEGLAKADIDGDGVLDIIGGGRWYKYAGDGKWTANIIDASYSFSRAAAGQLKKGGRPEVVLVVGDGTGPLNMYEWVKGTWVAHKLLDINHGHSLAIVDFDGDGNLDIFCAEMRINGTNPESKIYILLGDGAGNFRTTVVDQGYGLHESKIADLNGDGKFDILGKPYNWDTPRLDIWLNQAR